MQSVVGPGILGSVRAVRGSVGSSCAVRMCTSVSDKIADGGSERKVEHEIVATTARTDGEESDRARELERCEREGARDRQRETEKPHHHNLCQ